MFTHVHSSGRFDRDPDLLRRDVKAHREIGQLVTRTEITRQPHGERLRGQGWSFVRSFREDGNDECSVEWSNDAFTLCGLPEVVAVTDMTFFRSEAMGGAQAPFIKALFVPLAKASNPGRRLFVVACHQALSNTEQRRLVWLDVSSGLVELGRWLRRQDDEARLLLVADWNKNYRDGDDRALMQSKVARPLGLKQAWDGNVPAEGGTHGRRSLIDGDITDLAVGGCRLLPDTDASDHRPYAADLGWPEA